MGEWVSYRECWRIDLFALRCWPSGVGHRRVAYEVKVSRSDFRSEVKKPEKRQHALGLTHEFYFACPAGLIKPREVPEECGLVYVHDDQPVPEVVLRAPVRAPRPFEEIEVIYLARFAYYREGIERDRRDLMVARNQIEAQRREIDRLTAAL
jgi:hypothetical protein